MPASSPTKSGRRKLSEVARLARAPQGAVSTGWPKVRDTCQTKLGIEFDDWQHGVGQVILSKRADGKLAAMIDGVGMSLPRQVGKTYLLAALVFALCIDKPGLLVIWSAHHARTHAETFLSMQGFAGRQKVAPYVDFVHTGSGTEEIKLHNGSRILFGARERGFGRGIPGVDILIFDEAQILSDRALANMVATMNTSSFGLQLYIGTPPRPEDNSESFQRMRTAAREDTLPDGAWIEFGADRGADPDDRKQWAKANPSYPRRTPAESILRLKRKLTPEDFLREAMGIWDDDSASNVFGAGKWEACAGPEFVGKFGCLVVATAVDQSATTIAGVSFDGERYIGKPLESGPGQSWALGSLKALYDLNQVPVVVDARGPAAAMVPHLRAAGVLVETLDTAQVLDAHANMFQLVQDGKFSHAKYPELEAAVAGATTRPVGDRWAWGRRKSAADISPLEAVTLGVGFLYRPQQAPQIHAWPDDDDDAEVSW